MMVDLKDGRCRSCDSQLEIIDADDATMTVECVECGDNYSVETDAFGDGCMTYYVGFMAERMTGKEGKDGLTVTFDDGTVRESFLSWASFRQLLALKNNQAKPDAKPEPKPALPVAQTANGPVPVAK